MAITLTSVSPTSVGSAGAQRIDIVGDFTALFGVDLRVHVGPLGSSADPVCYSGRAGQGTTVRPSSTSLLRCYLPPLDPTGGPYDVYVQRVDGADSGTLATAITVLPRQYQSTIFALKRLMPPIYWAGIRRPEALLEIGDGDIGQPEGSISGILESLGKEDTDIGGIRMTRITALTVEGAVSIPVENVLDWPESGIIGIDNTLYTYGSRTDTTLDDIEHARLGVTAAGTLKDHTARALVLDLSRSYNAIDLARRAMLVNYAEGEDLSALGRNLGVLRPPLLGDDDVFREVIKALAYNPRGTLYGIELALDALLGSGNYEIFEDLIGNPNTVFIKFIGAAATSDVSAGHAYLPDFESRLALSNTTVDITRDVVTRGSVNSIKYRGESLETDTRTSFPTAQSIEDYDGDAGTSPWTFAATEGVDVVLGTASPDESGYLEWPTANASGYYEHEARVLPESNADLEVTTKTPAGGVSAAFTWIFAVEDGERNIAFGFRRNSSGTTVDVAGITFGGLPNLIAGTLITTNDDEWHTWTIQKRGRSDVVLLKDGIPVVTVPHASFDASTSHRVRVGNRNFLVTTNERLSSMYLAIDTPLELWDADGAAGAVAVGSPTEFDCNESGLFAGGDVGKSLEISGSTATNPEGGNNNGRWIIDSVINDEEVDLIGPQETGATLQGAFPTRIVIPDTAPELTFPDDLGKEIIISGSTAGNDGTYTIDAILDPDTLTDLSTFATTLTTKSRVCTVTAGAFNTETDVAWQLQPAFVTEGSLEWTLSDAGSESAGTITLRQALDLPSGGANRTLDITYSSVLSAQILLDILAQNEVIQETPDVLYEFYPFYITDPLGTLKDFVDTITAAGVIPDLLLE